MHTLSPAQDSVIARKYSMKSLQDKVENKIALQRELGWPAEAKRAMLCLPCGMSDELGGHLLKEVLPGILSLPVEIVIRGKGSAAYGSLFSQLTKSYGHRIAILPNDDDTVRKMYAASDMALFLSDPSALPELRHCLDYGIVPISPACGDLTNYDPNQEAGNAFTFEKPTVWHCFAAAVRAMETYRFPFDWRTIQKHAMGKSMEA